ncbi:uncharacterized protein N7506_001226 [Penicillium brevicompactum]|uniref:uncharacterized protein n=1 Tax=Penicillium brevicompactum TaxID=5074 RepID=UPI002540AB33|nr:uncharacterized protein N7506_001226 [Penicillium brevicompactum]KAJ5347973.1 hypothetical protein N7506_001226 [Penicillium brevicompactum]
MVGINTPDQTRVQIENAIAAVAAPGGKMGDNFRMKRSVWACHDNVLNHPKVGPFGLGMPVGTYRPDDRGIGLKTEARLAGRRIVVFPKDW